MSLSEASIFFQKFLKFAAVFIVVLIVGRISWGVLSDYWKRTHTPPPAPPNFALGNKITKLKINLKNTEFKNTTLVLDTTTGKLPEIGPALPIYKVARPSLNLLSLDRAKTLAESLGFIGEPEALSSTEYRWTDPETNKNLTLTTSNFSFHVVQNNPNPKRTINFSEQVAITNVKAFLAARALLPPELEDGTASARYVAISENEIKPTLRDSSNAVVVELFRTSIEAPYEVVTPNAKEALVRATVTLQREGPSVNATQTITDLEYTNWNINPENKGTYPSKPIELAWEEFQKNKAYVSVGHTNYPQLDITDIQVAHYVTPEYQELIQPVYVFRGKGTTSSGIKEDFIAYLPAIYTVTPTQK